MILSKKTLAVVFLMIWTLFFYAEFSIAQIPAGHAHNDYYNDPPFYLAHQHHFASIEADVFAVDGLLYVAHDQEEIPAFGTLEETYILPIVRTFLKHGGKSWPDRDDTFILLVDLKTPAEPAMSLLVNLLEKYPEVFDHRINKHAVQVVVSGNFPEPEQFENYPVYIWFDGRVHISYTPSQLKRVALISMSARTGSSWDGTGNMPPSEISRLKEIVNGVHALGKKIRFWGTPDTPQVWEVLYRMGVNFINTDKVSELEAFLNRMHHE